MESQVRRHGRQRRAPLTRARNENKRLRKVVADLVLEKEALKIVAQGNF